MNRFSKIRCDSGFSLIELLIAIAVSGIVLAGLVQVFSTANRSYTKQDEMASLQQNLRTAKMQLERDVRMAGCGFGSAFFYLGNQLNPLQNTNGGSNGTDTLTIQYVNYDDDSTKPQLTVTNISSPPKFTVSGNTTPWGSTVPFLAVYTRSAIDVVTNLISDVFEVTAITSDTLTCEMDTAGVWRTGFSTTVPRSGSNNSINFFSATQLVTITYSLSTDRVLNRTINEQPAEAIADDIEDLQFAFWIDTDGDGVVDNTEWVNNQNLDGSQTYQIRLVRISILGRNSFPLAGQPSNVRPAIEDHVVGTDQKNFLRELLQFEIKPRNLK